MTATDSFQGQCKICEKEVSKKGATRHLVSCIQKEIEKSENSKLKSRTFYLVRVRDKYFPAYWMYLRVPAKRKLKKLDKFIRETWVECCGHLSQFEIRQVTYSVEPDPNMEWDRETKRMNTSLDKILLGKEEFSYLYDLGTSTELLLKVVYKWVEKKAGRIELLARNDPPDIKCGSCKKESAAYVCTSCGYDERGWVCRDCAREHQCGLENLLPALNSPRAGVCKYGAELMDL